MTTSLRAVRDRTTPITAFVLSGGGNQGVSQVGMLRALIERGHRPDVIVGTSVGALNGAVIATVPTLQKVDHLEEVWRSLRGDDVFPGNTLRRAWNLLRRDDHLIPDDGLKSLIGSVGVASTFADLEIPLRVVAVDLITGDEHVIVRGPLPSALLASSALPGLFPPVEFNGHTLVDGAVVNLVPISHALAGPIDRIFVLDVSDPISDRPMRSPLDVAVRAFAISRDQRFELELQWVPKEIEVVVLPPPIDDRDFLDFSGAAGLIDSAYHLSMRALDDLEAQPGRQRKRRWWKRLAS
ncbi:MAG: patatin-like phospholipase family protein [Acidimicrobiia bacterium]|nr:patatin-like phospholipase family protein [Acidimicrobiia bacterium]